MIWSLYSFMGEAISAVPPWMVGLGFAGLGFRFGARRR